MHEVSFCRPKDGLLQPERQWSVPAGIDDGMVPWWLIRRKSLNTSASEFALLEANAVPKILQIRFQQNAIFVVVSRIWGRVAAFPASGDRGDSEGG